MKNNKLVYKLFIIPISMFFFSYALVPLYDVFCQLTGLNGKIEKANYKSPKTFKPTNNKNLKMEVVIRNNLPDIEFHTLGYTQIIDTNKIHQMDFRVFNNSPDNKVIQAVPSISPNEATGFFNKIECFCFNQQLFKPYEQKLFSMIFYLDSKIPNKIKNISMIYTVFDVTNKD